MLEDKDDGKVVIKCGAKPVTGLRHKGSPVGTRSSSVSALNLGDLS